MNFALSEEQFPEPESRDIRNKLFWEKLSEAFRLTHELLEETLEEYNIDLDALAFEAAEKQERSKHESTKNHECSRTAKTYSQIVDEWFEANNELLEEEQKKHQDKVSFGTSLDDSLKILRWYQHQIYAKVMRALSGQIDERSWESAEGEPKDSDGSAKVALIGIDRSIMAWMALRGFLPVQKDEIIDVLVYLGRLRKNIEKYFPGARAFIRPGFDEVEPS